MVRRTFEVVSLSFMDLICCGLGGMLILMLIFSSLLGEGALGNGEDRLLIRTHTLMLQLDCALAVSVEATPPAIARLIGAELQPAVAGRTFLLVDVPPRQRTKVILHANDSGTEECTLQLHGPKGGSRRRISLPAEIDLDADEQSTHITLPGEA